MFHPGIVSRLPASQASIAAETLDIIVTTLRAKKGLSVRHMVFRGFRERKVIKMTENNLNTHWFLISHFLYCWNTLVANWSQLNAIFSIDMRSLARVYKQVSLKRFLSGLSSSNLKELDKYHSAVDNPNQGGKYSYCCMEGTRNDFNLSSAHYEQILLKTFRTFYITALRFTF